MRKLVFIFILFILVISGCQKYNGKESADTASINNYVTAAPQIEEKLDYMKEAHLPPQSWNPLTASDDELKYYKYPPKPLQSDKLIEWKKTVTGGWYDAKTDSIPIHSHANVPCKIVWNNQVYNLDTRCGPITGHKIGKIGNGIVYEIQDVDSSIGIVLGYGDYDGHRATRIDYDVNDALSMLFSDPIFIKEKLDNLNFPHSAKKIESYVNRGNKKIPVQLETKIEEPEKLNYIITFTEIWNTKDYSYDGCTQPVGNHYWRFKVEPNSYSDLGSGGDVPPQAEVDKEEAEKLIITVGPPGDKYSKAVKQGDTVEFIKRYQGEYAEIPIIIDTTSEQGISMEQDSILIDCDAGWRIWEGIKPGGFVRSFHVQTNNTRNAKFIIKKILNNNNQNLLAEPLVFYVKC